MDYLDLEFHYKGKQSLLNFRDEHIAKLDGINDVTCWNGYVEFDKKRIYFQDCWFWYIIIVITDTLGERETFIKLSLTCKTRIYRKSIHELP